MEEAPAEHTRRVTSGPGGVQEGEPREYTGRQMVGLFLVITSYSIHYTKLYEADRQGAVRAPVVMVARERPLDELQFLRGGQELAGVVRLLVADRDGHVLEARVTLV